MLNLLFWTLVIFVLVNFTERIVGKRKTRFLESFFSLGLASYVIFCTFSKTSLWNIIVLMLFTLAGIEWLLDARKAQDERCIYCNKHILFWQRKIDKIDGFNKFVHKKCKK